MKTKIQQTKLQALTHNFETVGMATVDTLIDRGLFHLPDPEHWRLGDEHNGSTRRLDGRKWKRADTKGADWHRLIGLSDVIAHDRKHVVFVIEGSKDAIAAAELAQRCGILPNTGIICGLGSGYRPITSEIEQLKGRRVLLIGDNDAAGEDTANIVAAAMLREKIDFTLWDWSRCPGNVKDLFDLLAEFPEQAKKQFLAAFSASKEAFFLPSLSSQSSSLQDFKSSSNKPSSINKDELLGIVTPFVVTKKGTGNSQAFALARYIKPRKHTSMTIDEIVTLWFEKSKANLPPDATLEATTEKFHYQMSRVRFTDTALESAIERANKAKPPFIPARDGDTEIERLAGLCRELQRVAGDKPFICPVGVVQEYLGLRWRTVAHRLIAELEAEGVIQCVDRGMPNTPGKKGKPTLWRYKLSLE